MTGTVAVAEFDVWCGKRTWGLSGYLAGGRFLYLSGNTPVPGDLKDHPGDLHDETFTMPAGMLADLLEERRDTISWHTSEKQPDGKYDGRKLSPQEVADAIHSLREGGMTAMPTALCSEPSAVHPHSHQTGG